MRSPRRLNVGHDNFDLESITFMQYGGPWHALGVLFFHACMSLCLRNWLDEIAGIAR